MRWWLMAIHERGRLCDGPESQKSPFDIRD
jgi:hypothetical protein